jgi:hypothetical protein
MGSDWNDWRLAVFGDPYVVWHEGPDYERLLELGKSDPDTVERMLTAGLGEHDPLAAQSVRALSTAGTALPSLTARLLEAAHTATEMFLVRVAQALHVLTGEEAWADPIAGVLSTAAHWSVHMGAAMALADFAPTTHLVRVLEQSSQAEEYLVRYHAGNTLRGWASVGDGGESGIVDE